MRRDPPRGRVHLHDAPRGRVLVGRLAGPRQVRRPLRVAAGDAERLADAPRDGRGGAVGVGRRDYENRRRAA